MIVAQVLSAITTLYYLCTPLTKQGTHTHLILSCTPTLKYITTFTICKRHQPFVEVGREQHEYQHSDTLTSMVLLSAVICTPDVMSRLHGYAEGEGVNTHITNVARVFLERHGGRMAERWDESESLYRTERFVQMTHTCLPAVFAGEGEKHRLAALL